MSSIKYTTKKNIIALIDCNSFYVSCERLFKPKIQKRAVVVLSNNDGCVISRSQEAKDMGIKMGEPYFKVKKLITRNKIEVYSSNYALYGDISRRVMKVLKTFSPKVEIYSIDEAFVSVLRPKNQSLHPWARKVRCLAYQNLGITLTIGIGTNKVRAKIANKLAKNINYSAGIFDLDRTNNENEYLSKISVENIWGIGKQISNWLKSKGIKNAKELRDMNQDEITKKLGVVGKRLQLELKGNKCLPIEKIKKPKKEIQVSRSFGKPITSLEDLTQALVIYAIKASAKMRSQNLKSSTITVFARTSHYSNHTYQKSAHKRLIIATDNTSTILKTVVALSKEIYSPEYKLSKAGVLMQDLSNCKYLQQSINNYESQEKSKKSISLMRTIDSLNKKFNNEVITWAITKKPQEWKMNRNSLSPRSTTDIKKIPKVS